jgi:2'-5' RNA ligase
MRLFIAIPLAESVLTELTHLTARLHPSAPNLRWSTPESWHITLQFLGETTPRQYDCLIPWLSEIRCQPFPIQLAGLGCFDHAGVFFAGVQPSHQLISLQQQVIAATTLCEFKREARPFHPHISLARSKGRSPGDFKTWARVQPVFPRFVASEFVLYQSHLSPEGSTYQIRHRFLLHV